MAAIPLHHHSHLFTSPYYPSPSSFSFLSKPRQGVSLNIISCCLSVKQQPHDQRTRPELPSPPSSTSHLRVVLAAGGTGGHIIPAVAIADELKTLNPTTELLFIGTPNSMESTSIPSAGHPFAAIPAAKLYRPIFSFQNLPLLFHLIKSTVCSYKILRDFQPHVVVGTGGYVSLPTCLAALLKGIKVVIQEQNSVPGIANYLLSYFAEVIFVAYNSTVECFPRKHKCVVSGNPVRLALRQYVSKMVARSQFFPQSGDKEEGAKVILVLGGSFGANALNIAFLHLCSLLLSEHENWFIIWQTGVEAHNEMESLVRSHPNLVLTPFLHPMDLAYAAADLVISRAGAMTCSEILATGKPAILIPSPDVDEGHQFRNASLMADVAGSRIIHEDELDSTTLGTAIEEILGDENLMLEMSERALRAAKPDASAEIARHILSIAETSTAKK